MCGQFQPTSSKLLVRLWATNFALYLVDFGPAAEQRTSENQQQLHMAHTTTHEIHHEPWDAKANRRKARLNDVVSIGSQGLPQVFTKFSYHTQRHLTR